MRAAVRPVAAGSVVVCAATLITVGYVAPIKDQSLEALAIVPVIFGFAVIGSALVVRAARDLLAFLAGAAASSTAIYVAWPRLHQTTFDFVVLAAWVPTVMGGALGSAPWLFTRARRSWEAFRDEARAGSM